jgi:hypothetical protein
MLFFLLFFNFRETKTRKNKIRETQTKSKEGEEKMAHENLFVSKNCKALLRKVCVS